MADGLQHPVQLSGTRWTYVMRQLKEADKTTQRANHAFGLPTVERPGSR